MRHFSKVVAISATCSVFADGDHVGCHDVFRFHCILLGGPPLLTGGEFTLTRLLARLSGPRSMSRPFRPRRDQFRNAAAGGRSSRQRLPFVKNLC